MSFGFIYRLTSSRLGRPLTQAVLTLCILCGQSNAQEWKTLKSGVEYAEVTKEISGLKVNMNLLRLDLKKVRIDVHHAMDAAIGTEKTSSIATRHGAFAAINAGFFRLDTSIWAGDSVGTLQIDRKLLSESTNDRIALMIKNSSLETSVGIGHLKQNYYLEVLEVKRGRLVTKSNLEISGINRERKDNEIILFTPEFGSTTLTNPGGIEVIFRNTGKQSHSVEIRESGSNVIPRDGYILSASGSRKNELLGLNRKNTALALSVPVSVVNLRGRPQEAALTGLSQVEDITNGVPQLIKNSKIDITWEQEKSSKSFVETRHPRTAVAKLRDGKFLMITVDGRSEVSGGIGLQDLAEYLLSLGAADAMNLDGGGSTTMFVDGKVVNKPSDKEGERKVSDALVVTLRKK